MKKNALRVRVFGFVTLFCLAVLVALLYTIDPGKDGFIPCVFHQISGLYCAGCGTARALHALLRGDVPGALSYNILTTLLLPPLTVGLIWSFFSAKLPRERTVITLGAVIIAISVLFTILRNIPLPIFDILRP